FLEPRFLNNASWAFANCPDLNARDPETAVVIAQAAWERVNRQRGRALTGEVANTLGVAHYRNGDSKAAVEALNNSVQLRKGGDSFDFFFLVMAHWRLGEKDKARQRYDEATGNVVVLYSVQTYSNGWGWATPTFKAQRYTSAGVANGSAISVASANLLNAN